jgi:hypothetical protein
VKKSGEGLGENWNQRAAELLKAECWLTESALAKNMSWWKLLLEKGTPEADIRDAIRGTKLVMRTERPWWPCKLLGKKTNSSLWLEAISAERRAHRHEPSSLGAIMRRLAQ